PMGPMFTGAELAGAEVKLRFAHVGGGLVAKGGPPAGFALAGEDRKFAWATARIEGNTVVLSCPAVPRPIAVRYAWADNPQESNLYNREGLPASPFRTDAW
ncbi:MAG: 9-O-acetylesterase, partial [Thermoguttaceae bacterium]